MSGIFSFPKPIADVPAAEFPTFTDHGDPANFPIQQFPPLLRNIAEELSSVYQTPVCLAAMSVLAVHSAAVGDSVVVVRGYKDKRTRLNIYVIAVAERGAGKGNIAETLMDPLIERSMKLLERHRLLVASRRGEFGVLRKEIQQLEAKCAGATGNDRDNLLETLSNKQARLADLEADAEKEKTLWVGDSTSEALGRAMADNDEVLFVFSSEAGAAVMVALGKYRKEGQGDFDLLLSGYSGDSVRVNRIGRKSVHLESPCLALLWMVQGCVMRQILSSPDAMARGLTARPLVFESGAQREHDDRKTLSFSRSEEWGEFLLKLLDQRLAGDEPLEITCTDEAREVFARFHDESVDLERGRFADLQGELSRWRENAIKVAGLFAIAEGATTITAELAERATKVVRWCGYNYLALLQSGRRERLRSELERVLGLVGEHGGAVNLGTLARHHGIKRAQLEVLVQVFPAHLSIEKRPQAGAGRPAEVVTSPNKSSKSTEFGGNVDKVDLADLDMKASASP